MSTAVMIIGESGTGKSTSLRTLDPSKTALINVLNKPLPFPGWKKGYQSFDKKTQKGNVFNYDTSHYIIRILNYINISQLQTKVVIIDDFQYIMATEFMATASVKGFQKFTDMGVHIWDLIKCTQSLRENLTIVFLSHSDTDVNGKLKCKTIGKLLDEKVTLEGMFTVVLSTNVSNGKYTFSTQNNGQNTVKSPMGMFEELEIDNDLKFVVDSINKYNEG